ncbi:hypothetical protein ABIF69_005868 [Bradyrhizobium japonicum]
MLSHAARRRSNSISILNMPTFGILYHLLKRPMVFPSGAGNQTGLTTSNFLDLRQGQPNIRSYCRAREIVSRPSLFDGLGGYSAYLMFLRQTLEGPF